jgi:hypothetical protein
MHYPKKHLRKRNQVTADAVALLQEANPQGCTVMELAQALHPEESGKLDEMLAFVDSLPDAIQELQPDDLQHLRRFAEHVENGKRRGTSLTMIADKVLRCAEDPALAARVPLQKAHAVLLADLYKRALIEDVQTRVHDLRVALEKMAPDRNGLVPTVTRCPYKLVLVPCPLRDDDARAIEALYMLFDRHAWHSEPSDIETRAWKLAQGRFRLALATGMILADDGTLIPEPRGIPKSRLSDTIRDRLNWAAHVSHMMQEVFENFYLPCSDSPDPDRFHVLAAWARPYAVDIVQFFNSGRNEILSIMNPLFESIGLRPYPLVKGHEFPSRWVPDEKVAREPQFMSSEELRRTHRRLKETGVNHVYPDRAAATRATATPPPPQH